MGNRFDPTNTSSRLPKFVKSPDLIDMLKNLNATTRVKQQQAYAMQAKAASLFGHPTSGGTIAAAATAATSTETAELMKLMQNIKKDLAGTKSKTPAKPASKSPTSTVNFPQQSTAPSLTDIMKARGNKWQKTIGTKTVKGKSEKLCFFKCNHPDGCNLGTKCKQSHSGFPTSYKGGPLAKLPVATQWSILAASKGQ
jgi:hypothetical protein